MRAVAALPTRAPTSLFTATPSATPRVSPTPTITPLIPAGDRLPLPGTLIIADTGNNRVIEVTNDKRVIWEIATDAPDDATLTPTGNSIITNHARYNRVAEIEIASRKMLWSFGETGIAAPDDAHRHTRERAPIIGWINAHRGHAQLSRRRHRAGQAHRRADRQDRAVWR